MVNPGIAKIPPPSLAPDVDAEVQAGWEAIRDAREAAIDAIRANPDVTGADADRAARAVLIDRGYEDAIFHRTGHGIDRDIHGVGPTLDRWVDVLDEV